MIGTFEYFRIVLNVDNMSTTETKYFTPKEAKNTLPLVRKIVKDILDTSFQVRTIAEQMGDEAQENPEVLKLIDDMNYFMKELNDIGCYYKDWNFSVGLVDFPAMIDGEEVLLCWRSDEEDILYYHGVNEGYAGRKRIPHKFFE